MSLWPSTERHADLLFHHIEEKLFDQTPGVIVLLCEIFPSEEAFCKLHMECTSDLVTHEFLIQTFHLWMSCHSWALVCINFLLYVLNRFIVLNYSGFLFFNIFHNHHLLIPWHICFPFHECSCLGIFRSSFDCSINVFTSHSKLFVML